MNAIIRVARLMDAVRGAYMASREDADLAVWRELKTVHEELDGVFRDLYENAPADWREEYEASIETSATSPATLAWQRCPYSGDFRWLVCVGNAGMMHLSAPAFYHAEDTTRGFAVVRHHAVVGLVACNSQGWVEPGSVDRSRLPAELRRLPTIQLTGWDALDSAVMALTESGFITGNDYKERKNDDGVVTRWRRVLKFSDGSAFSYGRDSDSLAYHPDPAPGEGAADWVEGCHLSADWKDRRYFSQKSGNARSATWAEETAYDDVANVSPATLARVLFELGGAS